MRFISRYLMLLRVALLKLRGVKASWNAHISWSAEISPLGGSICIGEGTFIDKGVILRTYGGSISIGNMCSINPYCVLYGHGGLVIENGVRIATQTIFIPANHNYSDPDIPIYKQGETMNGIRIEEDVWIGCGVRILDGVTIGRGSVIAAGTLVSKTLPPFGVYAGVPVKKISGRFQNEEN